MVESTCGNCKYFARIQPMQPMGLCRGDRPQAMVVGVLKNQITGEMMPNIQTYWPSVPDVSPPCRHWTTRPAERPRQQIDLGKIDIKELEGSA